MPNIYDSVDFYFSEEGDYGVDGYNDIADTIYDFSRGLVQAIQTIVNYEVGSWQLYPDLGVPMNITGRLNDPVTAEEWDNALYAALTFLDTVDPGDLVIESFPVHYDALMTIVTVKVGQSELGSEGAEELSIAAIVNLKTKEVLYY